jgi:NADH-quinone oxidoreductase subunit G
MPRPMLRFRIKGLKMAREPRRYSGRTAMRADISVHEPRQPQDQDSALTYSMEGYVGVLITHAALTSFAWAPGWNSPSSME